MNMEVPVVMVVMAVPVVMAVMTMPVMAMPVMAMTMVPVAVTAAGKSLNSGWPRKQWSGPEPQKRR